MTLNITETPVWNSQLLIYYVIDQGPQILNHFWAVEEISKEAYLYSISP